MLVVGRTRSGVAKLLFDLSKRAIKDLHQLVDFGLRYHQGRRKEHDVARVQWQRDETVVSTPLSNRGPDLARSFEHGAGTIRHELHAGQQSQPTGLPKRRMPAQAAKTIK